MTKKALVLITDGSEEMEAIITIDVLRRAKIDVLVASFGVNATSVECSRGVRIVPDTKLEGITNHDQYDAIVIPGGAQGAKTLSEAPLVQQLLLRYYQMDKVVAAICAGSLAIKSAKIAKNEKLTSHPSVKDQLTDSYDYQEKRVVVANNLITSRGPGTTFEFALAIVEKLVGKEVVDSIAPPMILHE
ncbi:DJ-1-like protein [Basidiobolus meristosporus CBS 931.73]|uniref:D-lactate dehydratase n=1 Tax=Basidiobolus meristosporus CBS 931.73 TaxID=1314790 RepID=A0A1Y1XZT2_9FUNG|nr:DJ-1-like protein [Basidiobolus meristosporus CBS 931.73]|eukprot:ORX91267.1 DJ-1-like protein [Basidiobolus meristosporus CBS 931.73]